MFPKKFWRQTAHKSPRYQLYQPGFNHENGCWLCGKWITVPKAEWDRHKDDHDNLYSVVQQQVSSQHWNNEGVSPEAMSLAQRQAWEFCSGTKILNAVSPEGTVHLVSIDMAGHSVTPESLTALRQSGVQLIRWIKSSNGPACDQTKGLEIPEDLVSTTRGAVETDAVDPWQNIHDQHIAHEDSLFEMFLQKGNEDPVNMANLPTNVVAMKMFHQLVGTNVDLLTNFAAMMLFHQLLELEKSIIQSEWDERHGQKNPYVTPEKQIARYVAMRKQLQGKFDPTTFEAEYANSKQEHNECARNNLDLNDGRVFAFVLPKFYEDGTHDPWGPRDVPWNQESHSHE